MSEGLFIYFSSHKKKPREKKFLISNVIYLVSLLIFLINLIYCFLIRFCSMVKSVVALYIKARVRSRFYGA